MTNHKQERAQAIIDATMELTLRPQQGDRAKVIASALRKVVEELKYIGITEKNILELANELEALDELAQENPQVPLDAL